MIVPMKMMVGQEIFAAVSARFITGFPSAVTTHRNAQTSITGPATDRPVM